MRSGTTSPCAIVGAQAPGGADAASGRRRSRSSRRRRRARRRAAGPARPWPCRPGFAHAAPSSGAHSCVHNAAQQARSAVRNSASSATPRKLSNWPAKFASARSSINAEERTAAGFAPSATPRGRRQEGRARDRSDKASGGFRRQPALRRRIGMVVFAHNGGGEAEMLDLPPIGVGGDAEAARRRQSGTRQRRQIRCLRTDYELRRSRAAASGKNESRLIAVLDGSSHCHGRTCSGHRPFHWAQHASRGSPGSGRYASAR